LPDNCFQDQKNLINLDLSNNYFKSISPGELFSGIIKFLKFDNNKLSSFDPVLKIKDVHLSNNELKSYETI
jgi:Leucine-rich repeat (LRR) protein